MQEGSATCEKCWGWLCYHLSLLRGSCCCRIRDLCLAQTFQARGFAYVHETRKSLSCSSRWKSLVWGFFIHLMAAERLVLTANPLGSFWACSRQAASPETGSQTPRRQQGDAQSLDLSRSCEWNFHQLPAQRNCRNFSSSENFLRLIPFKKTPKYCLFTVSQLTWHL